MTPCPRHMALGNRWFKGEQSARSIDTGPRIGCPVVSTMHSLASLTNQTRHGYVRHSIECSHRRLAAVYSKHHEVRNSSQHFFACLCVWGTSDAIDARLTEGQTAPREDGFLARYNPCDCLLHREELSIEIRIGDRWTRVALSESDSVERRVSVLLNQMRRTPNKKQRIHGRLSDKLVRWAGDHYARQLILIPPPPTPDN